MRTQNKTTTKTASEEPEIYRNGQGNPVIFANKAQAIRKALQLGGDWSVHQSPQSRRFYVRKLAPETPKERLEYLRGELRAERISYDELHELQSLVEHIDKGDVELLEAAGVEEFPQPQHSPLPWSEQGGIVTAGISPGQPYIADCRFGPAGHRIANARLIVASVNHADKLAEALRDCLRECEMRGSDRTESGLPHPATKAAREALSAWEEA